MKYVTLHSAEYNMHVLVRTEESYIAALANILFDEDNTTVSIYRMGGSYFIPDDSTQMQGIPEQINKQALEDLKYITVSLFSAWGLFTLPELIGEDVTVLGNNPWPTELVEREWKPYENSK